MASTHDPTITASSDDVFGRSRVRKGAITISSYAAGGEPLTTAMTGLQNHALVIVEGDAANAAGYFFQYNYTTQKVMAFEEEAAAAGGPLLESNDTMANAVVRYIAFEA